MKFDLLLANGPTDRISVAKSLYGWPDGYAKVCEWVQQCQECPLGAAKRHVIGVGPVPSLLACVGEAPGRREAATGIPFVGDAGGILAFALRESGRTRDDVWVGNVVACRPPGNRTPEDSEIESCRPWLQSQLEMVNPSVIISLGGTANAWFGIEGGVHRNRGHRTWWNARLVISTFHPAYLLRNQEAMSEFIEDIRMASRLVAQLELLDHEPQSVDVVALRDAHIIHRIKHKTMTIAICSTDSEAAIAHDAGLVPFTVDELAFIPRDILAHLADAKKMFRGKEVSYGGRLFCGARSSVEQVQGADEVKV